MTLAAYRHPLEHGLPPVWASEWGEDRFGVFAGFSVGGVTQRLRFIPPGRFLMGSPEGEAGRYDVEGPVHEVVLAEGYWLADTPCTQALWTAVTGWNPSRFQSPTRPVEQVSWEDCVAFLLALNERVPGLAVRLPSEAEWEYACRAGTTTSTYAGELRIRGDNDGPVLDAIAWYGGNSGVGFELANGVDSSRWQKRQHRDSPSGTHPVAQKAPNDLGLYDTLGNVWEWCADDGHRTYEDAPADGRPWTDPARGASRPRRGGSWRSGARVIRAAVRRGNHPTYCTQRIGFRLARGQG